MALTNTSPNKNNYRVGGCRLYVLREGEDAYTCLGDIQGPSLNPIIETLDHFTAWSGTRKKDRTEVTSQAFQIDFTLDEFTIENLAIALRANPDASYSQGALTNTTEVVAVVPGRSVKLAKRKISNLTITDSSDTLTENSDFEVDYELGVIRWYNTATANAAVTVEYDCAAITGRSINPGSLTGVVEVAGLIFAFMDSQGGAIVWEHTSATISTNGNISLTDADWSGMPMRIEVLATNSTTAPFGTLVQF